jgi:hypothetical protein
VQDDEKDKDPTKNEPHSFTNVHGGDVDWPELLPRKEKDAQNRGKQSGSNLLAYNNCFVLFQNPNFWNVERI